MDYQKLCELGLSVSEARVYLALLQLGESQAGAISLRASVNRTTTYEALTRLIEKGLVKYTLQANRKAFEAVTPEHLVLYLKEQAEKAEALMPELRKLARKEQYQEESSLYKGRKGIRSILQDILKCKNYIAFGSRGKFLEIMQYDFELFQKRKKELKIKAKVILQASDRNSKSVSLAFSDFRFVSDEYSSPTTTFVYGDSVAIMVWGETPVATVIQGKDVAESYLHYFEALWKQAKTS